MSLIANCPGCGQNYKVGEDKAGRRFRCRECEAVVTVPKAAAAAEDDWGGGWDDDFTGGDGGGGDYGHEQPRQRRAAPAVQKKSKAGLIVGISLAVLLVAGLGVGAWFLFSGSSGASGPRAESLAYITDDAVFAVAGHPKQLLESEFFRALPQEARQAIEKFENELPSDVKVKLTDIEQVLFFGGAPDQMAQMRGGNPFAGNFGVVIRLKSSKDIEQVIRDIAKKERTTVEEKTYQGKKWLAIQEGGETGGFWIPDGQTLVISDEAGLRKIMGGNKQGRSTAVGQRLGEMPLKNDISFSFAPNSAIKQQLSALSNMGGPGGGGAAAPGMNLGAISKLEGVSGWVSLSGGDGRLAEITVEFSDSQAAKDVAGMIGLATVALSQQLQGQQRSIERELGRGAYEKVNTMISSLKAEDKGNNVVISINNPGGLGKLIGDAMRRQMGGAMPGFP